MGPNRLVVLVLAAGLLALSSCGAPPSNVGADAEDVAATPPSSPSESRGCAEFCDIAAPKGCPATGDCVTVCEAQRALSPGCGERFDALLACAAPEVNGSCGLPKQRSQVAGVHCDQEGTHYLFCTANDPLARTYAWWTTPPRVEARRRAPRPLSRRRVGRDDEQRGPRLLQVRVRRRDRRVRMLSRGRASRDVPDSAPLQSSSASRDLLRRPAEPAVAARQARVVMRAGDVAARR